MSKCNFCQQTIEKNIQLHNKNICLECISLLFNEILNLLKQDELTTLKIFYQQNDPDFDNWYFLDEEGIKHGPFKDRESAENALKLYINWLNK
jgi:hypothetical protein